VKELTAAIAAGMQTPGFSLIEVMTQCPTNYGRRNKLRQVSDMIEYMRAHAIHVRKRDRLLADGKAVPEDMFVVGELVRRSRPAMGVRR